MLAKSSLILLMLAASLVAQSKFPKFEDYPVKEIFKGTPAKPILTTPHQRLYQTRIREAAAKGPNFAGHYTIALWGCGSSCGNTAMIDAATGETFDPTFKSIGFLAFDYYRDPQMQDVGLGYRIDSRLVIIQGCLNPSCGSYYLEWTGAAFKTICTLPPAGPPEIFKGAPERWAPSTCPSQDSRR